MRLRATVATLLERMTPKTQVLPNGCWQWIGNKTGLGYGYIKCDGRRRLAHRVAYELHRGPIPDGLVLDHLCRHSWCVNPYHLEAVTQGENTRRGVGISVRNARKTHCPQGHPYSGNNVRYHANGDRICRTCDLARKHAKSVNLPNGKKTHCRQGHPFSPENTANYRPGRRVCKQCHRDSEKRLRQRQQAMAATQSEAMRWFAHGGSWE